MPQAPDSSTPGSAGEGPGSPRPRRPVIGITGGIGSGKSTVARAFAALGCVVADADADARAALDEPDVRGAIVAAFGDEVLGPEGRIDRPALARRVFGDEDARRRLEGIVHPRVHERREATFAAAPPDAPALVIDAPLLLEVGLERRCDAVVFVDCPREERLRRVRTTRGWDEDELARRERAQLPLDAKRSRADHVVVNGAFVAPSDPVAESAPSGAGPAAGPPDASGTVPPDTSPHSGRATPPACRDDADPGSSSGQPPMSPSRRDDPASSGAGRPTPAPGPSGSDVPAPLLEQARAVLEAVRSAANAARRPGGDVRSADR